MSNLSGHQPGLSSDYYQHQGYDQQYAYQQNHALPAMQQGSYGHPPQQQYGASPPMQQGAYGHPPSQSFGGQPPIQQAPYGQPSQDFGASHLAQAPYVQPPQGYGQQPPQHVYGGMPPAGQFPPTPASPGYDSNVKIHGNVGPDAMSLRKAMKRLGTDEKTLIRILSKPDPLQMALLRETYSRDIDRDLESDVRSETSGNFKALMTGLVAGPLMQDVYMLKKAMKGAGTNESMLNDILIGRSNADMRAIKNMYKKTWTTTLEADVANDLSGKTAQLFRMILSEQRAEDSAPIDLKSLETDLPELHRATAGFREDPVAVCALLVYKSDPQLRALAHEFHNRYQVNLVDKIESSQTGHIEEAVMLLINRACDRAMTDAIQLEGAMSGLGTKDTLLLNRVLRIHWNRGHMDQVKRAYQVKYNTDLVERVRGETSGDYERALVACLE